LIHSVIISFAEVSSHYLHVSNLTDSNTMPEYSVFEEIVSSYHQVKAQLTSGIKQQSLGNFASPPRCYTINHPNDEGKRKGQGNDSHDNKKQRGDDSKGWLKYTGNKKYPDLPKLTHCRMCKEFVTLGLTCPKSHQKECRFGVHVHFDQLTAADKKIVTDYCQASRTLSLSHKG